MLVREIEIYVPVYPTEDEEKIKKALYKYFPSIRIEEKEVEDKVRGIKYKVLIGKSNNILTLDFLRRDVKRRQSQEILKQSLEDGEFDEGFVLFLNKLALLKGKACLMSGKVIPALGVVKVVIKCENKHLVKSWLLL